MATSCGPSVPACAADRRRLRCGPVPRELAHHRATGSDVPVHLLYSVRTDEDVIGRDELRPRPAADITLTYTRDAPAGWTGPPGRVDSALLARHTVPPERHPAILVCGSTPFVETVTRELVALGHPAGGIKTERYGGMGDTT